MCQNVMQNVVEKARICNAARGGHLTNILYIMLRNKLPKYTKKKLINLVLFKNYKGLKLVVLHLSPVVFFNT